MDGNVRKGIYSIILWIYGWFELLYSVGNLFDPDRAPHKIKELQIRNRNPFFFVYATLRGHFS
jgi:hypothetical protein